ncbi:GlsB/YeaQ/YmgE family stress response membrane protein [Azotobacter beijerinckii]|uniref:Uncharacterized membrane protein YeaQ/YmgE, transglycosylase-associated protein family n=1 Tax=Azotobacter beijerinckii TaxID=170623 RepID=A0A1I4CEU3_9GAMM|nr:GlsB/YeaQ/YmgE family stress response membrane protein [Azotobacter beijerinckii]SFB22346.1 Uncharacterized membrane protein YeaQ/YmgE, transglycosylase-associated protein family [Azotobacter beijerinckii]SFK79704.1 Uncharacterized membrane protein YeaQ/YmgE, transglycosylase-associated protein family [Azotobacter beijerinckii]
MGILGTLLIGLLIGAVARFLKPGEQPMGWGMTLLLGIGGQALGIYRAGQPAGFVGAVLGAIVLLVVFGYLRKS